MRQDLCFPLKVHFGIDVGCVDRNMSQPCADRVDIDSGSKKVRCRRMPNSVRADGPFRQCWNVSLRRRGCTCGPSSEHHAWISVGRAG